MSTIVMQVLMGRGHSSDVTMAIAVAGISMTIIVDIAMASVAVDVNKGNIIMTINQDNVPMYDVHMRGIRMGRHSSDIRMAVGMNKVVVDVRMPNVVMFYIGMCVFMRHYQGSSS